MNAPRPQTSPPQMESNPLQRALDNYLVMEMQCEAARREASELRAVNGKLVAEVGMLRDRLQDTEDERRRWQHTSSTLLGRLLAINDTIAGAVKAAVKDGYDAITPKDEPGEADAVAAAASQCAGAGESTETAPANKAPPAGSQSVLAAIPLSPGQGQIYRR